MTRDVSDVTHRKCWLRFEKSQLVEFCRRKKKVDFSLLAEALWQVSHMVWGRWKSQHRKNVYLSPYVEKPFNSEVIKSFVPELRSRQVFFSCFRIPVLSIYVRYGHYEHSVYISHISVSWICYMYPRQVCPHRFASGLQQLSLHYRVPQPALNSFPVWVSFS